MTETLSTSKEIPKTRLALEEKYKNEPKEPHAKRLHPDNIKEVVNQLSKMVIKYKGKKAKLVKKGRQTKWAPIWAVLRKFGTGKRVHPSHLGMKRSWRRTKLKV